jgi:tRNA G18 (ribose-2'-O)-methylase SpoU
MWSPPSRPTFPPDVARPAPIGADDRGLGDYHRLVDARYRARFEAKAGVFVAEGHLAVERLLASPYPLRSLLVVASHGERFAPLMAMAAAAGGTVLVAEASVVTGVTGFDAHRGVLAVGTRVPGPPAADLLRRPGVLLAAEGVGDGENMGALGRNAGAFGARGLLLDPTCCDPLTRRAVRVSLGHILGIPVARVCRWPDDLWESGADIVALTPHDQAVSLEEFVASIGGSPPRTLVLVVGSEGTGLSPGLMARATRQVRIPMAAGVDSLNVATAAAVALSHLPRWAEPIAAPKG